MRVVYTSDIHVDVSEKNRDAAGTMAGLMQRQRPDVVVVAGDAGNTIHALEETLSCFSRIDARKFFVPGNHDVWIENDDGTLIDSRTKYADRIPDACRRVGFHDLGQEPVVVGDVGFVGSLGWYDYSFADPRLELTEDDYWRGRWGDEVWWDKKMTYWIPGADEGNPGAHGAWAKGEGTRDRMRDPEVCAEMGERLQQQLLSIEGRVKTIVAVIHTLPFLVGLPRSDPPYYLDAFTGSERLGRVLEAHTRVERCIHGHKHTSGDWTVGRIRAYRRTLGRIEEGDNIGERAACAVGIIDL
jgi:predicted phosphohydrolase